VTLCWLGMNDRIYSVPFWNSHVYTRTAHHIRSYGLSQSAAISLATYHLAAEGQHSSLKIPFNGDWFCHTLTVLGGRGDYARNIPMWVLFLVTDCDRVLTDVIQCGPETIFPGNQLCARRRTRLTHVFSFFAYFLLFTKAFKVNSSFWIISSVPLRKYNPGSLYFRIYLRSPELMSSCRWLGQTLNNFIVAHYPSCRSKITWLSLWVWLGC